MSNLGPQPSGFGNDYDDGNEVDEIVIVGHPIPSIAPDTFFPVDFDTTFYGYVGTYTGAGSNGSTSTAVNNTSTDGHHEIHTYANNPDNSAKVNEDAMKLAKAVAKIDDYFLHVDPNKIVYTSSGQAVTMAQVKDTWNHITFNVTDNPSSVYNNGGVGAIKADGHGGFDDSISIEGFNNVVGGSGGYDSPNYQHDEGLIGLALHELGHELPGAQSQYNQDFYYYNKETGDTSGLGFAGSDYFTNNERFANEAGRDVAAALGMNTAAYDQQVEAGPIGYGWQTAEQIHNTHIGANPYAVNPMMDQ